jgi:hypothetical protein
VTFLLSNVMLVFSNFLYILKIYDTNNMIIDIIIYEVIIIYIAWYHKFLFIFNIYTIALLIVLCKFVILTKHYQFIIVG